jgi:hypothetical protein
MSKSGRYAASRFKIESVASAKTVEVHDCGTMFTVAGGNTLTLPAANVAGKGWWIRVVKSDEGTDILIVATSTLDGQAVEGGGSVESLSNNFSIDGNAGKGSWAEIWSDGSQYYATGIADSAVGFNV